MTKKVLFTDKAKSSISDVDFFGKLVSQTSPSAFPLRIVPVSDGVTAVMSGNTTLVQTNIFYVSSELRVLAADLFIAVDVYHPAGITT